MSRVALASQYREAEGLSLDAMRRWRELYGRLPSSYDAVIGVVLGALLLGGLAVYAALRRPWRRRSSQPTIA